MYLLALGAASGRGANNSRFGAEYWPLEGKVSIREFGREMEQQAILRGILVSSKIIETNDNKRNQIVLFGIMMIDKRKIHIKLVSIFGANIRLDLSIIDSELLKQSHVDL